MKLLPSLKQKKRYIVFEIISDKIFTANEVQKEVDEALQSFLGRLGISKSSPMFLKERYKDNKFIIKVNHKYVDECISAVILMRKIKTTPVIIKSMVTSGTLKKVSKYL